MAIFTGSGVAIITPFKEDLSVDYEQLRKLIDFQIENGTDAIIICGTTGEASTLSHEEHLECIKVCIEHVNKRVPVVAGTGSNCTETAVYLSKEAAKYGADGLLVVTPYYNKATQKGLIAHFTEVAKSADLPMILYNVPGRTGCNILPETAVTLAKNVDQIVPILSLGGKGVISVLANVVPKETHDIVAKYLAGETEESLKLQLKYMKLIDALFCEVNPIPVKKAVNLMGMNAGGLRMPLTEMEAQNAVRLAEEMKKLGIKVTE